MQDRVRTLAGALVQPGLMTLGLGTFLAIMAPGWTIAFASVPVEPAMTMLGRQDLHLRREVIKAMVVIGPSLTMSALGHSILTVVTTLAVGYVVGYLYYVRVAHEAVVMPR
mgnify:CR=1 FL=1